MEYTTVLKPKMSEKAYALSQTNDVYVFLVPGNAVKQTVAKAVAAQFKVTVAAVNITNVKGKAKRTVRKGGRAISGRQKNQKKAYVKLKKGDTIPIFAAVEQAQAESDKLAKQSKKAADKELK